MNGFDQFIANVEREILSPFLTLIALAAFVVFVWGVVEFILGASDAEKRRTGQRHMIWGVIGLVIIFGANAIVAIIKATIGVS
jgi:uncharacterized membrane protein YidH (DUF202 family)